MVTACLPKSRQDLTGCRFGGLTVLTKLGTSPIRCSTLWVVTCDCGKKAEVAGYQLYSGGKKSCGCRTHPKFRKYSRDVRKDPEYIIWKGMRARVLNKQHTSYSRYGGRGVTVDPAFDNYEVFLAAVGRRPSSKAWLERKDNSKGYIPGNVEWATPSQQARNTRRNNLITYNGLTKPLAEWCEELDLPYSTIRARLRDGWGHCAAIETPVRLGNYRRKNDNSNK